MQLAYLSDAAIPSREANSIQTMKMCEAFAAHGLEVRLFVPNRPTTESRDPYEFYNVDCSFDIVRIPWRPGERYLYSLLVPFYVHRFKPDIVFGRFVPACFFTSLLGYSVVIESHSPVSNSQRSIRWMFKMLVRMGRLQHLVVISDALREHYLGRYDQLSASGVSVAHDAASEPQVVEPIELGSADRLQVGYIGHLYDGKGMTLIADMVRECHWADFHIVGGTTEDIDYWRTTLDGNENVEFHGFVEPNKVSRYQQSMDVLLAPYQQSVYGNSGETDISNWMSPLKIFEYMAAGKPILCSDLPVLREVLDDRNALLLSPSDPSDWVRHLRQIETGDLNVDQLGENARRDFLEQYTYSARASRIIGNIL